MAEYVPDPKRSDVWNKKRAYGFRLRNLLQNADKVFCVSVDNVGSKQMQQIRFDLRGKADIIMGKNTTIRKVMRDFLADNKDHPVSALLPLVNGNVGFVFTSADVAEVRDVLVSNRVPAPARVGAIAPTDVIVPAGPTGCDPGQTSWFQALQIATKINRGQIEIISDVPLIAAGSKVGNSEAALLQKLNINPFTYGIVVLQVYDNGEVFDPQVLDLSEADMMAKLASGITAVAALSLGAGYPTLASLPHSLSNAFKHCVAIALETEFSFEKAEAWKEFMANPGAFLPAGGAGGGGGGGGAAAEAPKEESEKEESVGGAGGMFEDDEDDW